MTVVLQHYLSDGEMREPFLVCTILGFSSGTRTINSPSLQWRASHIRSSCSRLTLSVISWYKSLIVFGRMPVALARSACVHLSSPSFVDNKILIIRRCSFRYKIAHLFIFMYHLLFYSGFCYILSNYNICKRKRTLSTKNDSDYYKRPRMCSKPFNLKAVMVMMIKKKRCHGYVAITIIAIGSHYMNIDFLMNICIYRFCRKKSASKV